MMVILSHLLLSSLFLSTSNLLFISAQQQPECPDLTPACTCTFNNLSQYLVNCFNAKSIEEIGAAFNRNTTNINIYELYLYIRAEGDFIPAYLLGRSRLTNRLYIYSQQQYNPSASSQPILKVDPNAFRTSSLEEFYMSNLDSFQMQFDFLAGFPLLSFMSFTYVDNMARSLLTLPVLPALDTLFMASSFGLNEIFASNHTFLQTSKGLGYFSAYNSKLDEDGLAWLLDWILPSSSQTLGYLGISGNYFKTIPPQFASFRSLTFLEFRHNQADMVIPADSIYWPGVKNDTKEINLGDSRVIHIEPGAFQGFHILISYIYHE